MRVILSLLLVERRELAHEKISRICNVLAICMCMLICGAISSIKVSAKEANMQMVEPRMTYIYSYSTELSISSNGVATITGIVKGKSGVTSTYVKVTLQKSESGEWVDVESWEKSSDTRNVTVAETYQVSRGTYRVEMTCSANGETKTVTSAERVY